MCRIAGRRPWRPGPQPARHALSATKGRAAEAGRRLGLPRPHCNGRARTTIGARSVEHPTGAPDGVEVTLDPRCQVSAGLSQ
jgi:hypothetical protein